MMKFFFFFSCLSILLFNCKKKTEEVKVNHTFDSFDHKSLLENIAKNIILPEYKRFEEEADSLHIASMLFLQNPSTKNLEIVRLRWKQNAVQWRKCELFKFGPSTDIVKGYLNAIKYKKLDTAIIHQTILKADVSRKDFVESLPATAKGLYSLEYLLFSDSLKEESVPFMKDSGRMARKHLYIVALVENLRQKAKELRLDWAPEGGDYLNTFINSLDRSVSGSLSLLVNEMVYLVEEGRKAKVGLPAGKIGTSGVAPKLCEGYLSRTSLDMLSANIHILEKVFKGGTGTGLDDLLNETQASYQGKPLSEFIEARLLQVKSNIQLLDVPLEEAIIQHPEKVDLLYKSLQNLQVIMKMDMVNHLGISLTFSDNDGD